VTACFRLQLRICTASCICTSSHAFRRGKQEAMVCNAVVDHKCAHVNHIKLHCQQQRIAAMWLFNCSARIVTVFDLDSTHQLTLHVQSSNAPATRVVVHNLDTPPPHVVPPCCARHVCGLCLAEASISLRLKPQNTGPTHNRQLGFSAGSLRLVGFWCLVSAGVLLAVTALSSGCRDFGCQGLGLASCACSRQLRCIIVPQQRKAAAVQVSQAQRSP
jgi:hypothetical protein